MNDDLTTRLSRQLHGQVDDLHAAPLTLESVRGRADGIRRHRRLAVAGIAAVAVAAIIVPAALVSGGLSGRTDLPPVDQPSESPAPTPRADGTFPLTIDAPAGAPPETGYIDLAEQQLVTPSGSVDLPGDFVQISRYGDGWVGIRADDRPPLGTGVVVLDGDLQEVSTARSAPSLVTSADRSRVAWVEAEGAGGDWTLVNAPVDGGEPVRTPVPADSVPEGFLSEDTVAFSAIPLSGKMSYGQAGPEGAFDAPALAGFQRVGGISEVAGLVAGQTAFRGDSTCSEMRRTEDASVVWKTCDYQLDAVSPDGAFVIGLASYSDNGSPSLSVLDAATGLPVVDYTSGRTQATAAVVHAADWEDEDSVIALVEQGGEQTLVRADVDGSLARLTEPRPVNNLSLAYHLPHRPFGQ